MSPFIKKLGLAAGIAMLFVACASTPEPDPFETEKLLVAAGFSYKIADTPELLERLKNFPQHQLIQYQYEGRIIYVFADKSNCTCVFLGEEEHYQKYLEIARSRAATNQYSLSASGTKPTNMDVGSFMDKVDSGTLMPMGQ